MRELEYKILKYCPDRSVGEFANVGVLVFDKTTNALEFKSIKKYHRINEFFGGIQSKYLLKYLKAIHSKVERIDKSFIFYKEKENYKTFDQLSNFILVRDSSSLCFSESYLFNSDDIKETTEQLFQLFIEKHEKTHKKYANDEEIWKKYYKICFEKFKVSKKLLKQAIETQNDVIKFEYTYQNGVFNIYKPLSFNLADADNLKEKVYKWNGIVNELQTSNKKFKLHFLTYIPEEFNNEEMHQFIKSKLEIKDSGKKSVLYDQNDIERLNSDLKLEFTSEHH